MELRAEIIGYEGAKQQLIEIVEAHLNGQTSGAGVSERLQLSMIPDVIDRINSISADLNLIGDDRDLFANERPFKDLVLTLNTKRAITLCRLDDAAKSTFSDRLQLQQILQELKLELAAISKADDALGDYIKAIK